MSLDFIMLAKFQGENFGGSKFMGV